MSFEAKYRGFCGECEDVIAVGDKLTYREDVVVHLFCNTDPPQRKEVVCTNCFLIQPCECD